MNTAAKISLLCAAVFAAAPLALLLTQSAVVNPPSPVVYFFPGPTNFPGASNYIWWVQSTTDFLNWVDEPTIRTNDEFTVNRNERPKLFFRWKGMPL